MEEKEDNKEKENSLVDTFGSRVYELGYLLVPTIAEEDVSINYGNLKEVVSSFGADIISDEMPKMIPLAYSMLKVTSNVRSTYSNAYFGWIKFTLGTDKVLELKKKLDLDPNIVRFMILKTVKENTIAAKRFVRTETYKRPPMRKSGDSEPALPIDKAEIDKEIEALIAV